MVRTREAVRNARGLLLILLVVSLLSLVLRRDHEGDGHTDRTEWTTQ